jgi:hypothetical protein
MGSYLGKTSRNYLGPIYDQGAEYKTLFDATVPSSIPNLKNLYSQAMWVIPAMAERGFDLKNGIPPTDVTIKLRVAKPYKRSGTDLVDEELPRYTFNTESIFNNVNGETGKKSVDLINIVPNPYYAYSAYETSPIDNKVKITNLPPKATISIYTLSGTLVRRIKKDDELTWSDWDLKNNNKVPIASGFYIIHVDAGDLGEKVLKWFGVMRQLDLDTY